MYQTLCDISTGSVAYKKARLPPHLHLCAVVKFELFELYYWLELYEFYFKNIKFIKPKMQIIEGIMRNVVKRLQTADVCELKCNLYY